MDSQHSSSEKLDVYQMVTDRIIALLEADTVPWQKPWMETGIPMNAMSKRAYRGINLWLLLSLNYDRNLYLTWDQIKKVGASVNHGQHGHIVVFWKNVKKQPEELVNGKPKMIPMLRYYKVFNVEQCRDLPKDILPELLKSEVEPLLECEAVISTMVDCPVIKHKEQKAYYHIAEDYINMPRKKSFKTPESYYSVLFHELVHSTGAEKRLGRKSIVEMAEFGSDTYSMEELIAEMGASYLNSFTGILDKQIKNSAAYLKNWLEKFRSDKRFIIQASGQAQKAVDLILNRPDNESKNELNEVMEESTVS